MKITKSKLKQLIKEEIKAVREALFDGEYDDENVDIFDPSTYEGMFDSEVLDSFEESLTEFVSKYLHDEKLNTLEDDEIEDLKAAVMTALEGAKIAEDEEDDIRDMIKAALENIEAANSTGDLK